MYGKFIIAKCHRFHYVSDYLYSKPQLTPTFCNRQHHLHDYKCLPPSDQQMRLLCGLMQLCPSKLNVYWDHIPQYRNTYTAIW